MVSGARFSYLQQIVTAAQTSGWEQGEGHGPRKELFALVGQQMLRGCEAQPKLRPALPYVAEVTPRPTAAPANARPHTLAADANTTASCSCGLRVRLAPASCPCARTPMPPGFIGSRISRAVYASMRAA